MLNTETGLYTLTINEMIKMLSSAYVSLISNNVPFSNFPAVMLWGPPGVGKSQGVREVADVLSTQTKKKVVVTDVRLMLFNPVDLRGIPTANEDKTLAVWLKPQIFQMDESDNIVNILFLDEISAAPPSVQAAAYQITLDRTVGEHRLPSNCIVIAAGNRVTDKSVAYSMPKALANRLCHLEIKGDTQSWHDWAVRKGLHEYVVGYLEYNSVALMRFDSSENNIAFPTPRSWELVSNILTNVTDKIDAVFPMIVGCIGYNTASNLQSWSEIYRNLPRMEKIFSGFTEHADLKAPEMLIALRSAMVSYAKKHPKQQSIDKSINFSCSLPWAFRRKLLHDYYQIPELRPIVKENEIFKAALQDGLK